MGSRTLQIPQISRRLRIDLKVLCIPVTITIPDIPDTPSSEEVERHLDRSLFTDGETSKRQAAYTCNAPNRMLKRWALQ